MALTPQLLQAIKLLQMTNLELSAFVEEELLRNPILDRDEAASVEPVDLPMQVHDEAPPDWTSDTLTTDQAGLAAELGTEIDNAFDCAPTGPLKLEHPEETGLSAESWTGVPGSGGETPLDAEDRFVSAISLGEHLEMQATLLLSDPIELLMARALIDSVDEAGLFRGDIFEIADQLGAAVEDVRAVLTKLKRAEPTGVFARDLSECLALQLIERNRFDPAMQALIANLPLLGRRDFTALKRICGVADEDLADMIREILRLEPKPGRAFGSEPIQVVVPDVLVSRSPDGAWRVELNSETLPRVLVNERFVQDIRRHAGREQDKQYLTTNLQNANWLTKSLDQRARTIISVCSEIVRRQDAFLIAGVSALKPLTLKIIADVVGVHESTVSRATANKFMRTPRGTFEIKYFFSTSIASTGSGETHSSEAVRYMIKEMIDAETINTILSDDEIVEHLRNSRVVVARRTVAKYREQMRLPSSIERRRQKSTVLNLGSTQQIHQFI